MKRHIIVYFFLFLFPVLSLVSCEDGVKGAGNATVGFEEDSYTFLESEGTVKVPVVFTGEPEEYPITFSISASVDDGVELDDVAHFVQVLSSLRYNGNGDVVLEIELQDNFEANPDRNLVLEIVSADGAEIVNGRTTLVIRDNDGDIYEALQGQWTFHSTLAGDDGSFADGQPKTFTVSIDAGGSSSEIAENTEKRRLRVLGWEGFTYSDDTPALPFAWYLDIKYSEELGEDVLWTVPDIPLIDSPGDPLGIGVSPCSIILGAAPIVDGKVDKAHVYPSQELPAECSGDFRTITFVDTWAIIPLIYSSGGFTNMIYNVHTNITLTR